MAIADVTPNRRGARSREVLLDAAERVMAEHGYAGATLALLVEASGLPASSIYHYFGSKDGVLHAVMERGAASFFSAIPEMDELVGTPREHMTLAVAGVQRALETHPGFLRLLLVMATQPTAGTADDARAVVGRVRDEARRRLREQCELVYGGDTRQAAAFATFALAVIDGAFVAAQADPGVELGDVLAHLPVAMAALLAAD